MRTPLRHRSASIFGFGMATLGTLLVVGTVIGGMKLARDRAYADFVSSCSRVTVFRMNGASYLCAPIARTEPPAPPQTPGYRLPKHIHKAVSGQRGVLAGGVVRGEEKGTTTDEWEPFTSCNRAAAQPTS